MKAASEIKKGRVKSSERGNVTGVQLMNLVPSYITEYISKKGEKKNKAIDHMDIDQSTHSISGPPVSIFHIQQQYQRPL